MARRDPRNDAGGPIEEPATHEETIPAEEPRRPIQEFRLGRIKAAVWANETQLGTRHSVTITRCKTAATHSACAITPSQRLPAVCAA